MQRGRVQAHNYRRYRISSHGPHVSYILTDISLGAKMNSARSRSLYFRESKIVIGSDNLSENIRTRERHIAFSVFCLLVFLPSAGHHVLLWKMYFTNIGDLPLWQLPQIG